MIKSVLLYWNIVQVETRFIILRNNKVLLFISITIIISTLIIGSTLVINASINKKTPDPLLQSFYNNLEELEKDREYYIKEGKEVPESIEEKIRAIKEEIAQEEMNRRNKKQDIVPTFEPRGYVKEFKGFDDSEIRIDFYEEDSMKLSTPFGDKAYLENRLYSVAKTKYNILASGCRRDNPNEGIIINKVYEKDFDSYQKEYSYPGKGIIKFYEFDNDKKIVKFTYGDGLEGYFDTELNIAVFEKYEGKKDLENQ